LGLFLLYGKDIFPIQKTHRGNKNATEYRNTNGENKQIPINESFGGVILENWKGETL
jgi:hypothetical protein